MANYELSRDHDGSKTTSKPKNQNQTQTNPKHESLYVRRFTPSAKTDVISSTSLRINFEGITTYHRNPPMLLTLTNGCRSSQKWPYLEYCHFLRRQNPETTSPDIQSNNYLRIYVKSSTPSKRASFNRHTQPWYQVSGTIHDLWYPIVSYSRDFGC